MAGTVHPNPNTIGTNAFPFNPIVLMILSIKNATLDIYPLSSKIARKKYKNNINGTKTNTPPTPAINPSNTNEFNQSGVPSTKIPAYLPINPFINPSSQSCNGAAPLNTTPIRPAIKTKNIGNPKNLFNKTLSTLSVKSNLDFIDVFNVCRRIPFTAPYLLSANTVSTSSSNLSSILFFDSSTRSILFIPYSSNFSKKYLSASNSLITIKSIEYFSSTGMNLSLFLTNSPTFFISDSKNLSTLSSYLKCV